VALSVLLPGGINFIRSFVRMFLLTLDGTLGLSPLNYKDTNLKRVLDAGTLYRHQVLHTEG
jgi:hypothetical protein